MLLQHPQKINLYSINLGWVVFVSKAKCLNFLGFLTFCIIVAHGPHGCLEICGRLLLNLVGQVMNFEPV